MKTFEELNEVEKALRSLIFAAESRRDVVPTHPFPLGGVYLDLNIGEAKEVAERFGIPLAERRAYAQPKRVCDIEYRACAMGVKVDGVEFTTEEITEPNYFATHYRQLGYEVIEH